MPSLFVKSFAETRRRIIAAIERGGEELS